MHLVRSFLPSLSANLPPALSDAPIPHQRACPPACPRRTLIDTGISLSVSKLTHCPIRPPAHPPRPPTHGYVCSVGQGTADEIADICDGLKNSGIDCDYCKVSLLCDP